MPPPKFYVQLNPIQIYMDVLSVLWANSFALNLHQSLQKNVQEMNSSLPYVDVKIEAVMPRVSTIFLRDRHLARGVMTRCKIPSKHPTGAVRLMGRQANSVTCPHPLDLCWCNMYVFFVFLNFYYNSAFLTL